VFGDKRGWFSDTYRESDWSALLGAERSSRTIFRFGTSHARRFISRNRPTSPSSLTGRIFVWRSSPPVTDLRAVGLGDLDAGANCQLRHLLASAAFLTLVRHSGQYKVTSLSAGSGGRAHGTIPTSPSPGRNRVCA
jgi:hypothetical protein